MNERSEIAFIALSDIEQILKSESNDKLVSIHAVIERAKRKIENTFNKE